MFVIILHITQKRSRLIAIIPFAGVSLMYDIMNPIGFILEVPAELQMRRKQRRHRIAFTANYGQCKERKE